MKTFDRICQFIVSRAKHRMVLDFVNCKENSIHSTVRLGVVYIDKKNVTIGKGSYMNSGQIFTGEQSKVVIGDYCAIGYNVNIKARSHDPLDLTKTIEDDIIIGDHVWIGDNVFIDKGVIIGDHSIIGANAVVIKDIPSYVVAGGVPAKIVKKLNQKKGGE